MFEQEHQLRSTGFSALHKIVFVSCGNLHGDTASATCHYRFSFPECFCHDQTETFANGFLQNHSSAALEDIDLHTPHTSHIREQIEIWILDGLRIDLVQYFPALGIVPCHGTHHRELNIRNLLLREPVRADNSERIFPGIEARDLKQQWPAHINAHLCDGAATDLRRQIHVLGRGVFIPPAIDPLSTKNMDLPPEICRRAIAEMGIDVRRPLLLQVSRFDPWKDPLGVIRAYRLAKEKIPDIQLAMVGAMAGDDPQGWEILDKINLEAVKDPDLNLFTNMTGVGSMEVNVFQRSAAVVLQKSIREGFGLVVAEAFWKGKPVVAGRAGGIPMQFPAGYEDYLVESTEDCAAKLVFLLEHSEIAEGFGRAGQAKIRTEFLLPRLIRDELRLIRDVIG